MSLGLWSSCRAYGLPVQKVRASPSDFRVRAEPTVFLRKSPGKSLGLSSSGRATVFLRKSPGKSRGLSSSGRTTVFLRKSPGKSLGLWSSCRAYGLPVQKVRASPSDFRVRAEPTVFLCKKSEQVPRTFEFGPSLRSFCEKVRASPSDFGV